MKKIITIFIGLSVLVIFSGCAGEENGGEAEDGDDAITVAVTDGDIGQFNAWEAKSEEFTEETGIDVKFTTIPYDNLLDRITTEGISGDPSFDIVTYVDVMGPSIKQFLEPLDDYASDDFFDQFPESTVELSTYDDQVYSLPLRANAQVLFYRKDVFDDLDLDPPETWEELEESGKKIVDETDKSAITPYYEAGNNGQNLYIWTSYLWSKGGDLFDDDMKPIFNEKEGLEATKDYINLLKEELAPEGSVSFAEQESGTHFKQDRSAMWIGWWWVYPDFNSSDSSDDAVKDNVGFTTVPKYEDGEEVSSLSTFPLGMLESSDKKEEAWEFMEWLSDSEREKEIVKDSLEETSPSDQFSIDVAHSDNLEDKELNELGDDLFTVGGESFENAETLPTFAEWPQVADIISDAISDMATGQDVEKELDEAAEKVEELLEEEGYYD